MPMKRPGPDLDLRDDGAVAQRGIGRIHEAARGAGEAAEAIPWKQVRPAKRHPPLNGQAVSADPAVGPKAGVDPQRGGEP